MENFLLDNTESIKLNKRILELEKNVYLITQNDELVACGWCGTDCDNSCEGSCERTSEDGCNAKY
ncbi:hypothetical protein [Anaerocolumna xylanovorans]|uniref:Uncharacterized protein n=1 Tax=Anaerocolumna xylanovorans DSM 12503 TaxID=1121345 RepID=A0A1M7Y5M8_9FIRM|nr:hypothetical protein [Anaerocolumna xylanovorans]SHO47765.1 hypothetical protein SAMN02745217_01651 [Anaerocolumna xylanovorans DSM 12503]